MHDLTGPLHFRGVSQVTHGLQTPKKCQPSWNLWMKLLFWFNRNVCLALPSCAIPYGQRYIKIQLADKERMIQSSASVFHAIDVYHRYYSLNDYTVNTAGQPFTITQPAGAQPEITRTRRTVREFFGFDANVACPVITQCRGTIECPALPAGASTNITVSDFGPGAVDEELDTGEFLPKSKQTLVKRYFKPQKVNSVINYPSITSANIYANNIFTHSVLHDIYVNTVGYTLIRIHKTQSQAVNT